MGSDLKTAAAGRNFALLGFVPDQLGAHLNSMRRRLVPECPFKSHVTVLPPRALGAPAGELSRTLDGELSRVEPFEVELGDVQVFPASGVIYLSIETGFEALRQLHDQLTRGEFGATETYPFHPHVTLAQEFPLEHSGELVERASELWNSWTGQRSFELGRVSLVQGEDLSTWETVREYEFTRFRRRRTV